MFLKMFKSGRIAVKKAQPAVLTLDAGPQPHKFSGLFAVQKSQVDYRGRAQSMPTFKMIEPRTPDKPSKPEASAPKPVKVKPSTVMPEVHASLTQMLSHLKDVAGTVASLNVRIAAIESDKAQVDKTLTQVAKTLNGLAPFTGSIKGGDSIVPGQVTTLKSEIDNIAHLLATATSHREVSALRQQLAVKCEALDNLERAAMRDSVKKHQRANELTIVRGFLVGSGIECRRGV